MERTLPRRLKWSQLTIDRSRMICICANTQEHASSASRSEWDKQVVLFFRSVKYCIRVLSTVENIRVWELELWRRFWTNLLSFPDESFASGRPCSPAFHWRRPRAGHERTKWNLTLCNSSMMIPWKDNSISQIHAQRRTSVSRTHFSVLEYGSTSRKGLWPVAVDSASVLLLGS